MEQALADLSAQVDRDASPCAEADVYHRIAALRAAIIDDGETPFPAMDAELIALAIRACGDRHQSMGPALRTDVGGPHEGRGIVGEPIDVSGDHESPRILS